MRNTRLDEKKAKDALTVADKCGYHVGPVELTVCGGVVAMSDQFLQISWENGLLIFDNPVDEFD
ncbi:MAG: hypothetical protein KGQ60_00710 [Planctomycetes bacterium]|nr:hypothetical protein [Planctomycetota bacterium]